MGKVLTIYADGACRGNPGVGGWGFHIIETGCRGCGGDPSTTNNIMELTAAIEALIYVTHHHSPDKVTIRTDSQYVVKGMNEWVENWISRGWRTSANKPIKNKELWWELYELTTSLRKKDIRVDFEWVRGHDGDQGNELADGLANNGIGNYETEGVMRLISGGDGSDSFYRLHST